MNSFYNNPEYHYLLLGGLFFYFIFSFTLKIFYILSLKKNNYLLRHEISDWALWFILVPVIGTVLMGVFSSILAYNTRNLFIYNHIKSKHGFQISIALLLSIALTFCGLILFGVAIYIFLIWFWIILHKNNRILTSYQETGNLHFPY